MLPTSRVLADLTMSEEHGWQPLSGKSALYGVWLAEGGGYLLEIDRGGDYSVADDSGEPIDRGQWALHQGDLTLSSSGRSTECSEGDRLVFGGVDQVAPGSGTTGMRMTVGENACGVAWTPAAWILIPQDSR